ncbi:MAG: hypothetical protein L0241_21405 [Planctomycetia bacterium]|nr:hypothetical protein [Planctomycetia bacterium]
MPFFIVVITLRVMPTRSGGLLFASARGITRSVMTTTKRKTHHAERDDYYEEKDTSRGA